MLNVECGKLLLQNLISKIEYRNFSYRLIASDLKITCNIQIGRKTITFAKFIATNNVATYENQSF
jgi:hypothetical protein